MAAVKSFALYLSLNSTTYAVLQVPESEQANVEAAILAGGWYTKPGPPVEHWNMASVARYKLVN